MKILGTLPPREIKGADEVLEGAVFMMASGNLCRFWPAMTADMETDQTRIAFFMEWYQRPTDADVAELTAHTDQLMGKPSEFVAGGTGDERALEWLRTGKEPKPN